MNFENPKTLALLFIAAGIVIVFVISGFSARNLFIGSVIEEATVQLKQEGKCVVEGSDRVPRTINNCPYNVGDTLSITYKAGQPAIEKHELKQAANSG